MPFKKGQIPWNKTVSNAVCLYCKKDFHISPSRLKDTKIKRGIFCSKKCTNKSKIGKSPWNKNLVGNEYTKHYKNGFGGIFFKVDRIFKGSSEEYQSLHYWVRKELGKPSICQICYKSFVGKNIQWANKSGLYRKETNDWIRLCTKCHFIYDNTANRKN